MIDNFIKSFKETTIAIIPICIIVTIIAILFGIDTETIISFITSSILLIIGLSLFTFGADLSMIIIGEKLGNKLIKVIHGKGEGILKSIIIILFLTLIIGTIITIAEPDLNILANQITSIPKTTLILAVGIGVGVFLMIASMKILFKWSFRTILIISYTLIFAMLFFVPLDFIPIAFDSSGVTTGPISAPFILALGLGITASRTDSNSQSDTFGLIALCSIGPIIAVLILGMLYTGSNTYDTNIFLNIDPLVVQYVDKFIECSKAIFLSLTPIAILFLIFKTISKDAFNIRQIKKITLGLITTFLGLTIFLTGVDVGFMKTGYLIGQSFINSNYKDLIIPFGMLIGFLVVLVEPAIKVLNNQVEDITEGSITKKMLQICLSVGVAIAVALSLLRISTGISIIYVLIPYYLIALILSFITPKVFTSIAFDSGGCISGPLTATFILPFVIGACAASNGNIMTDAFGLVAFVAMSPLITIQLLGLIFKIKTKNAIYKSIEEDIIEYDWRTAL